MLPQNTKQTGFKEIHSDIVSFPSAERSRNASFDEVVSAQQIGSRRNAGRYHLTSSGSLDALTHSKHALSNNRLNTFAQYFGFPIYAYAMSGKINSASQSDKKEIRRRIPLKTSHY